MRVLKTGLIHWPADFVVSASKACGVSWMCCCCWALVPAPLMPLVAFVELPPQKADLSSSTTLPPACSTVCAALWPASPPPTTMIQSELILACQLSRSVALCAYASGGWENGGLTCFSSGFFLFCLLAPRGKSNAHFLFLTKPATM